MGRTVGQQWYGGTEGSPWNSLQSPPGLRRWEGLWDSCCMVGGVPGTPFSPHQDSGDGKDCETAVVWWDSGDGKDCETAVVWWNCGESQGLHSVPAMTQGIERTWEDSVGLSTFVGLPSVPRTVYCYFPWTPFSPQDCLLLLSLDSLQSPGLCTVPGDLKDVQWRHENSDGKPGHD